MCSRFIRQQVEAVKGNKYDKYFKGTARDTGLAFAHSPYLVPKGERLQVGDLLIDLGGPESLGHIVCLVSSDTVGENSVVHWDGNDSRGLRSLSAFYYWDIAVRLP